MKNIWVITCEGKPISAYETEQQANLFVIRTSNLIQINRFKVTQVALHTDPVDDEHTVYTPVIQLRSPLELTA